MNLKFINEDTVYKRSSREFLNISDFYAEDTIVFVICKSNCSNIEHFSLWDYIVDLYRYGYTFTPELIGEAREIYVEKNVNLQRISEDVKDKIFIIEIFKTCADQFSATGKISYVVPDY